MTAEAARKLIQETFERDGYKAAAALAEKIGILWYASAGATRKR